MANEKRLIDANELSLKIIATKFNLGSAQSDWQKGYIDGLMAAFCLIKDAPTVDAVEVVRCKDCKHYRNHPNGLCYAWTEPCTNERGYKGDVHCVEPDDFCSYGERRSE